MQHDRADRRPNMLVVVSHDLGRHIGPYGWAKEHSGHLLRLAAEGMRFDAHFVTSPGCSQSRSSLVTGRYPHANGQFGLAHLGWRLNDDEVLLPAALRAAGYRTTLFGIWHLHAWTLSGFDTVSDDVSTTDSSPEGYADIAGGRAARWLRDHAEAAQPFYLHVGFWETHRPFRDVPSREDEPQLEIPEFLPDHPSTRREMAQLHQSLSMIDEGLGHILTALGQAGLDDNTIVLFTADHGLPFPRAKGTVYDPGIQVALLARWPGHIAAGSHFAGLSSNVDIMPTLLEAAGVPIPRRVQGASLLGYWDSKLANVSAHDAVFAEKTYHEHYDPIRAVRTGRFKYIRNFAPRPMLVLPSDVYNSPTRRSMTNDEDIWSTRPAEELYDLEQDPAERTNLVADATEAGTLDELRSRLEAWMQDTSDPLLQGPIPRSNTAMRAGREGF